MASQEDTSRHARVHDINEMRKEMREDLAKHDATDQRLFTEIKSDQKVLRDEIGGVKKIVDQLALDSTDQNGKLDTLVTWTEGKFDVLKERTDNIVARTKSKERLQEKTADTQALEVREKRSWKRDLLKVIVAGLFTTGGAVLHFLLAGGGR